MTTKTADLYDTFGERLQIADPVFQDFGGITSFGGPVVTVKVHEDNTLVRDVLEQPGEGRVLVVDGGGSRRCALLGDQLAKLAHDNEWSGVVIFGCVRDAAVLETLPIGIKALAAHPRQSAKRGEGQRDVAVQLAGVRVTPGSWLYADRDGLVISNEELL